MEELKDESYKSYDGLSRYSSFPYYYNEKDNKYIYGITSNLDDSTTYIVHNVKPTDNLDYLSNKYYGRPDYFWIIADFNRIDDAFIENLYDSYKTLKIPTMTSITYIKR